MEAHVGRFVVGPDNCTSSGRVLFVERDATRRDEEDLPAGIKIRMAVMSCRVVSH